MVSFWHSVSGAIVSFILYLLVLVTRFTLNFIFLTRTIYAPNEFVYTFYDVSTAGQVSVLHFHVSIFSSIFFSFFPVRSTDG